MGLVESGTPEHKSNMIEQSIISKDFTQDNICEPLVPENHEMGYERFAAETIEPKEVAEAQNIESKLVSMNESSDKITEIGQNQDEISQYEGTEKPEPLLENVKAFSVAVDQIGVLPGITSVSPDDGKLEPFHLDTANNFVHSENEDRGLSGESSKTKAKFKGPVISSWSLRSKSQEKPKPPEPNEDTVKEGSTNGEKKKRGRKKKQNQNQKNAVSEFSRIKTHLRYLLHRVNYEQYLIDSYSAEGWRGQSVDKLKPEKQLQQAKSHILRYKLKIRALFQQLDESLAVGKLPESLFDAQGEIDSEDIFCAKCGTKDLTLDNDIILCDGACERGFHQFCLEPPLLKTDIPPGDESWLCPGCDCKAFCVDMLKDYQGTKISIIDSWEKIFPEAAAAASGMKLDDGAGSSSDDSEDEEYDPDKPAADDKVEGDVSSSDESSYFSASDDLAAPLNNDKYLGLPSDDSEDDDFDPSASHQVEQVKQDSSSSDFTSDSEDLEGLLQDETVPGEGLTEISPSSDNNLLSTGSIEKNSKVGRGKRLSLKDEVSYLVETGVEPLSSKRHAERLDYKKLNDETYGNSSDSSDEDFNVDSDDTTPRKNTKTNRKRTEAKSSNPITKSSANTKDENKKQSISPKPTSKNGAVGGTPELSAEDGSASMGTRTSKSKRLGEATTQRLYASFKENQYPERAEKENLAKELGITCRQVSKWFDNARWSYNHRPQAQPNLTEKPPEPQSTIGTDSTVPNQAMEVQEPRTTSGQNVNAEAKEENLASNACGENSGTRKTRKRKDMQDAKIANSKSEEQKVTSDQSPQIQSSQRRTRSKSIS